MNLSFGVPATLAIAGLVLITGRLLIAHIEFLRRYAIPEPVADFAAKWGEGLYGVGFATADLAGIEAKSGTPQPAVSGVGG